MKYFAIHDQAAGAYLTPFYAPTNAHAVRSFRAALEDPETMFSKFPGDYTLFELGRWNEETGHHMDLKVANNLGNGLVLREAKEDGER